MIKVGDIYGGGVVFYTWLNGIHGLISSTNDLTSVIWGCEHIGIGTERGIGKGGYNTTKIINSCEDINIAARVCHDVNISGFTDWHLPSLNDLIELYKQKDLIGGFTGIYWSSFEFNWYGAWCIDFDKYGLSYAEMKQMEKNVRPIRMF